MGRVGTMEELQNLATFLISGGCDWINGETIAMDGAQALATGGNFYQLRDWSDADWKQAREPIKAQNEKDRAARDKAIWVVVPAKISPVVPAKAGTHSHQRRWDERSLGPPCHR